MSVWLVGGCKMNLSTHRLGSRVTTAMFATFTLDLTRSHGILLDLMAWRSLITAAIKADIFFHPITTFVNLFGGISCAHTKIDAAINIRYND
jgi:hypothetical protein